MSPYVVSLLLATIILKPQEFVPFLKGVPLVYALYAAAVVAIFFDWVWRRVKPALAPQLPFLVGFLVWGALTTFMKRPDAAGTKSIDLAILCGVVLATSIAFSSAAGLRVFAATFAVCALCVTGVAVQQGFADQGCFLGAEDDWEGKGELEYDGRACETVMDCRKDAPVPDGNYRCEKVGPWNTASIGGRVRYRGSLADPNELSLMVGMGLPFVFYFGGEVARRRRRRPDANEADEERRPEDKPQSVTLPWMLTNDGVGRVFSWVRRIPIYAITLVFMLVVFLAKSRGGLVVIAIVLGAQFVRRAGAWGVVAGMVAGPPLLVAGMASRAADDAEASSGERVELLREAFDMVRATKGIGIGVGQFGDESSFGLTAHNSYVLALAEAGIVGVFLFAFLIYLAVKVPIAIWFGEYALSKSVKNMAPAIAVALLGACVGIFFLSWSYKDILYMAFGASAALYGAARAEDPRVKVGLSLREWLLVPCGIVGLLTCTYVVTRIHL